MGMGLFILCGKRLLGKYFQKSGVGYFNARIESAETVQ